MDINENTKNQFKTQNKKKTLLYENKSSCEIYFKIQDFYTQFL